MKSINSIIIKNINQEWLKNIELTVVGFKFNEKKNMVNLSVAITKDNNKYDKDNTTNLFEKISINSENLKKEQLPTFKIGRKVKIDKISNVATYGQFSTDISLTGTTQFYD